MLKRIGALALIACGAVTVGALVPVTALAGKDGAWGTNGILVSEWGATEYQIKGVQFQSAAGTDVFLEKDEAEPGVIDQGGWVLKNVTENGVACSSLGALLGEVRTESLEAKLGLIKDKTDEMGLETRAEGTGDTFAKFTCGETAVELRGAVIGQITPVGVPVGPTEHFTVSYAASKSGKQAITKFQGGKSESLEVSVNKGKFKKVAWVGTDTITPSITDEIMVTETKGKH
jgi:hypothetical protein